MTEDTGQGVHHAALLLSAERPIIGTSGNKT